MTQESSKSLYKEAGVDIEKGDKLVEWLQSDKSRDKVAGEVVSGIGGFAALFDLIFWYGRPVTYCWYRWCWY